MQPGEGHKKKSNVLVIVLAVFGVIGLLLLGTCAVGVLWVKNKAEAALEGGALVVAAPPEVLSALAGPKRDYVGVWKSEAGSTLSIDPSGALVLDSREGGGSKRLQAPIAAFVGNDIEMRAFVVVTIAVTEPPHQEGGKWRMTADGIRFARD